LLILSIDAATQVAGAAVLSDYIVIAESNLNTREAKADGLTHSETLLPLVEHLLMQTGLTLKDMDCIACASGPGSFTGLRIGAATAMGLARGANLPLIPVPTLCSLAYNAGSILGPTDYVVPVMDARRGQVYSAFYSFAEGRGKLLTDYLAMDISEVLAFLSEHKYNRAVFLGDGADAYREIITGAVPDAVFAPAHLNRQRASSTGMAALHMIRDGYQPVKEFELLYVRKPQAVRERERKLSCLQ
jgi:tRNA threonylcarbamoyladenosine biosynthesis protein TsaB